MMGLADEEGLNQFPNPGSQQFWKANSKLKMADREQGIKNLASNLLGGRLSTDPAVTRLVSRSSTTSESPSTTSSPTSATLLLPLLLYLCDSQGESADPPNRWGNASSTWMVMVIKRKSKADLGWERRWGGRRVSSWSKSRWRRR